MAGWLESEVAGTAHTMRDITDRVGGFAIPGIRTTPCYPFSSVVHTSRIYAGLCRTHIIVIAIDVQLTTALTIHIIAVSIYALRCLAGIGLRTHTVHVIIICIGNTAVCFRRELAQP